jgi:membrane-associated protease RseP (regulator of RpoE activity)
MKIRLIAVLLAFAAAFSIYADAPVRRTVIVRDGKVIRDDTDGVIRLDRDFLGGGKRAYLGVRLIDLTPDLREHYGAPKDAGILVGTIDDGSPAAKAGLRVGDIILSVDGKEVESPLDVRQALTGKKEGESVRVEILRKGNRQTLVAGVEEREGPRFFGPVEFGELAKELGPEWRARFETGGDCASLQSRIKELETRLKDLEKKLQK